MQRSVIRALEPAIALALCAGCVDFDPRENCRPDGGEPCEESWCADHLTPACEKKRQLCGEEICEAVACPRLVREKFTQLVKGAGAAEEIAICVEHSTSCVAAQRCFERVIGPVPEKSNAAFLLPTRVPRDDARGGAGLIVLPGDDLECVRCSLESGCAREYPNCFSVSPLGAGPADTCLEYRTCLRTCAQTAGGDGRAEYLCARTFCDAKYRAGRQELEAHRSCMFERCRPCLDGKKR